MIQLFSGSSNGRLKDYFQPFIEESFLKKGRWDMILNILEKIRRESREGMPKEEQQITFFSLLSLK